MNKSRTAYSLSANCKFRRYNAFLENIEPVSDQRYGKN